MDERNENVLDSRSNNSFVEQGPTINVRSADSADFTELKVAPEAESAQLLPSTQASISDLTKAMPSAHKQEKGDDSNEPLTQLPRAFYGLLVALSFTTLLWLITPTISQGLFRGLWCGLPLQIYFTYCIFRLSNIIGLKRKMPAPLSALAVTIISVISFTCMPVFQDDYHFINRWYDPFWILWSVAQCAWPFILSQALEKTTKIRTFLLASFAAIPVFLMSILTLMFNLGFIFTPIWFMTQFGCVLYLSLRLRELYADDLKVFNAKLAIARAQISGVTKDDIIVRYKPFSAVERWVKQRFTGGDLIKGMQLALLWVSVPLIALLLLVGLTILDTGLSSFNNTEIPKTVSNNMAIMNGNFLRVFLFFVSLMIGVPLFVYLKTPTHLLFNRKGLRFLWRHGKFAKDGAELNWRDLESIDLERPSGSTQALDQFLCFKSAQGTVQKMKLSAFDSIEDREKILAMIRHWAPNVPRPPEVEQCLEPPANHSYTEMWLQALAAPPKRERLKPLLDGASLQTGTYRVINSLGVGGQGSAYLASDNINDRTVVLKEFILPVHVDVNVRKSALESFENEARILKQLNSDGVVKLIDFFVEDHRAYLVLEHIDGMSLRELVEKNGAMKESQVKELAQQMCSILSYLHSLSPPVVHRDFTPDNLILQRGGTLKLIDFNVAQQVEATVTGTVVGKHAYLPPEQFRGMPTSQSDIYAFGATLHFLLTGADPEPISQSHPGKQVPDLSAGMDHIVAHATHLDCGQRYETVEHMGEDLKNMT